MCVYVPAHARVCVSSAVHNPIIDSVASSATKTHTHREGERARAHLLVCFQWPRYYIVCKHQLRDNGNAELRRAVCVCMRSGHTTDGRPNGQLYGQSNADT